MPRLNYIWLYSICGLPSLISLYFLCIRSYDVTSHMHTGNPIHILVRLSQKNNQNDFLYISLIFHIFLYVASNSSKPLSSKSLSFDWFYRFATDSVCMMKFLFRMVFVCGTAIGFVFYEYLRHMDHRYDDFDLHFEQWRTRHFFFIL